jgi:hypothetical protein
LIQLHIGSNEVSRETLLKILENNNLVFLDVSGLGIAQDTLVDRKNSKYQMINITGYSDYSNEDKIAFLRPNLGEPTKLQFDNSIVDKSK